jgi:enamine deaminase RidA (YjgF/YER057c/UK114 family)
LPTFSHVVIAPVGQTVYISGQVSFDAEGRLVGADNVGKQIETAFSNLGLALASVGLRYEHIVKVTHYFVDFRHEFLELLFKQMLATFPADRMPTSTLLCISRLARDGLRYEITAEAVRPSP